MNGSEHEYLVLVIRSGKIPINVNNARLHIHAPTVDELLECSIVYNECFDKCKQEGIMDNQEMNSWLLEKDLWNYEDENNLVLLEKGVENIKLNLFESFSNKVERKKNKARLKNEKEKLLDLHFRKNQYFINTCEGVALSNKTLHLLKRTTRYKEKVVNFKIFPILDIVDEYHSSFLEESAIRTLARNDPWKSLWSLRKCSNVKLFRNTEDEELLPNQKNLLMWSQIYDNIQESMDCPKDDIINDDDALDGWFIQQRNKRHKEEVEKELNSKSKNTKISNAQEVFYMAHNAEEASEIYDANSNQSRSLIKQRKQQIDKHGNVKHSDLLDQKQVMATQRTQQELRKHRGR